MMETLRTALHWLDDLEALNFTFRDRTDFCIAKCLLLFTHGEWTVLGAKQLAVHFLQEPFHFIPPKSDLASSKTTSCSPEPLCLGDVWSHFFDVFLQLGADTKFCECVKCKKRELQKSMSGTGNQHLFGPHFIVCSARSALRLAPALILTS